MPVKKKYDKSITPPVTKDKLTAEEIATLKENAYLELKDKYKDMKLTGKGVMASEKTWDNELRRRAEGKVNASLIPFKTKARKAAVDFGLAVTGEALVNEIAGVAGPLIGKLKQARNPLTKNLRSYQPGVQGMIDDVVTGEQKLVRSSEDLYNQIKKQPERPLTKQESDLLQRELDYQGVLNVQEAKIRNPKLRDIVENSVTPYGYSGPSHVTNRTTGGGNKTQDLVDYMFDRNIKTYESKPMLGPSNDPERYFEGHFFGDEWVDDVSTQKARDLINKESIANKYMDETTGRLSEDANNRLNAFYTYLGKPQNLERPTYSISQQFSTNKNPIYSMKDAYIHPDANIAMEQSLERMSRGFSPRKGGGRGRYYPTQYEESLLSGYQGRVPDSDSYFGNMGGFGWEQKNLPGGKKEFVATDTWDLNPLQTLKPRMTAAILNSAEDGSRVGKALQSLLLKQSQTPGAPIGVIKHELTKPLDYVTKQVAKIEPGRLFGVGSPVDVRTGIVYDPAHRAIQTTFASGGEIAGSVAQGAMSGAVSGVAFPPWGPIVGGIIGGGAALVKGLAGNAEESQQEADARNEREQRIGNVRLQQYNNNMQPFTPIPTFSSMEFGGVLDSYYTPASRPTYNTFANGGSFGHAYKTARTAGEGVFEWNGKEYSTMSAEEAIAQNKPQWVYQDRPGYRGIQPGEYEKVPIKEIPAPSDPWSAPYINTTDAGMLNRPQPQSIPTPQRPDGLVATDNMIAIANETAKHKLRNQNSSNAIANNEVAQTMGTENYYSQEPQTTGAGILTRPEQVQQVAPNMPFPESAGVMNSIAQPRYPAAVSNNKVIGENTQEIAPQNNKVNERDPLAAVGDMIALGTNAVKRKIAKGSNQRDPVSSGIQQMAETDSDFNIRKYEQTGDTINYKAKAAHNQYYIPEVIDLNNVTLGARNRGDYTRLDSKAGVATAFKPFEPYETHAKKDYEVDASFMGIDKDGKIKLGGIRDFAPGDVMSRVFKNTIKDFNRDETGEIIAKKRNVSNAKFSVPEVITVDEKGNEKVGSLNLLLRRGKDDLNTYGDVTGGRVIMSAGGENKLVSGSVKDIEKQFLDMKNKYGNVDIYSLDNGTFNKAIRSRKGFMDEDQLRAYDAMNTGGGNFLYLKENGQPKYKEIFTQTPNVRTTEDESYKKGHGLINEKKAIVLHHTAEDNQGQETSVASFMKPGGLSAHVIIKKDGTRQVFASPDQVTFHAGESSWKGRDNLNDFAVGVEFGGNTVNTRLTKAQIESYVEYILPIIQKNNIPLENIVSHKMVSPLRKPEDMNEIDYNNILDTLKKRVYERKAYGGPIANNYALGGNLEEINKRKQFGWFFANGGPIEEDPSAMELTNSRRDLSKFMKGYGMNLSPYDMIHFTPKALTDLGVELDDKGKGYVERYKQALMNRSDIAGPAVASEESDIPMYGNYEGARRLSPSGITLRNKANGGYVENPAWYKSNALSLAAGGHLVEGNATLKEAKEYEKLYPEEFAYGLETEYEHTGNKKLAMRIAADHIKDSIKMNQGAPPDYYKKLQMAGISDELNKMPLMTMKNGGVLSASKASEMLKDGKVHGKKLTERQKRYFQAIAHGWKPGNKSMGGSIGGQPMDFTNSYANGGIVYPKGGAAIWDSMGGYMALGGNYQNGGPEQQQDTTKYSIPKNWSIDDLRMIRKSDFQAWPDSTYMPDVTGYLTDPAYGVMAGYPVADTMKALTGRQSDDQYKYLEYLQQAGASPDPGSQGNPGLPYSKRFYEGKLHLPQDSVTPKGGIKALGGNVPQWAGTGMIQDNTGVKGNNENGTNNGKNILTKYQGGGTHEQNSYGGIQVGGKAKVEDGEYRFDDPDTGESYVFSNRF